MQHDKHYWIKEINSTLQQVHSDMGIDIELSTQRVEEAAIFPLMLKFAREMKEIDKHIQPELTIYDNTSEIPGKKWEGFNGTKPNKSVQDVSLATEKEKLRDLFVSQVVLNSALENLLEKDIDRMIDFTYHIAAIAKQEEQKYIGKQKREWYMKGYKEGKEEANQDLINKCDTVIGYLRLGVIGVDREMINGICEEWQDYLAKLTGKVPENREHAFTKKS